jgi:outer membrane murein-binding lipoprotein Lpp
MLPPPPLPSSLHPAENDPERETNMRPTVLILGAATAAALLAGCSREEEPIANRFERQAAEIQNKAQEFEAQVEKEVSAAEARLEDEVDTLMNSIESDSNDAAESEKAENTSR